MMNKKGYTKYELVSVIIIVGVIIAIFIPVMMSFMENERRNTDGLAAERAEDVAQIEYMQHHSTSGETVVYMFTGDSEVLRVYRHWRHDGDDFSSLTTPRTDGYDDGSAIVGATEKRGKSKRVGERPLYVAVSGSGEVVYNSWRELNLR